MPKDMLQDIKCTVSGWLMAQKDAWLLTVPPEDRVHFQQQLTYTNITRLRTVAWLLIMAMLVLIATQLAYISEVESLQILARAPQLLVLRLLLITIAATFLVLAGQPQSQGSITPGHSWYARAFILASLICFALLAGIIESITSGIASSYLLAVIIIAAFIHLSLKESLLVFSIAWATISATIWWLQSDWLVAYSAFLNCTFVTVMALIIARVNYAVRVKDYLNLKLIKRQKEELAQSNDMLRRMSYLDALTDIPNRRYFDEYISREWNRAGRDKRPLTLLMIDVDKFKLFNDTYGHQAGDRCLTQVAKTLSRVLRRTGDFVARYGGEEFVVVLSGTDHSGAGQVAERMRRAVAGLNILHPKAQSGRLTVSIGMATRMPGEHNQLEQLIAEADSGLYRAKRDGGNKCQVDGAINSISQYKDYMF